ncbi:MAG: histidine triad nucleotide-binding protein [Piscirickettsiaceae bacterium]|nr:histidine triad nucleotide-binding protein [Piscirickettsiaceae bacterium]
MSDCLFCKILAGDIPSEKVFEDEQIFVFKDIFPKASVHLLVVPKIHIDSLEELNTEHEALITHIMLALPKLARSQGLKDGFRTIINTGPGGGQEVGHLHIHILGGDNMPSFN